MKPKRKATSVIIPGDVRYMLSKMAIADQRSMQREVEWLIRAEADRRADAIEESVKGISDPDRPEPATAAAPA